MPFFNALSLLPFVLFFWASRVRYAYATGIKFIVPAPGQTLPAGNITITWADAGGTPDMSDLVSYNMSLIVGGILASDSKVLMTLHGNTANALVADQKLATAIPAEIGQSIQNGYYLSMTSNTSTGNQVINYSNRFTLIDLNGTTDQQYVAGANSAVGNENVPAAQYNVNTQSTSTASTPTSSTSTSATSSLASTATTTPSATSTNEAQFSISGGELAGLAIGTICAFVLFLILAVMSLLWWRRRQRTRKNVRDKKPDAAFWEDKVELSAQSAPAARSMPLAELSPAPERFEAGSPDKAVELSATEIRFELESDWTGWEAAARRSRAYDPTL